MIPILYESNESSFTSNGIHRLIDTISCTVVEERNSIYECDFEYPVNGQYFSEITCGRIIGVRHDDSSDIQPFDIVSFTKPIDGIVSFHAVHVSYRLKGCVVQATNINSLSDALTALASATPSNPFTYSADFTANGYAAAFDGVPRSVRQVLGGVEGSLLDAYGGEYEWNKFSVVLHNQRGTTVDFAVRYGFNMVDYNDETDYSDAYTSAIPYWIGQDANGDQTTVVGNKVSSGLTPYDGREKCVPMDLSESFEDEPTTAELEAFALAKMTGNDVNNPRQNIKVDFVRLQDFSEYHGFDSLLQCKLCDKILVVFPDYQTSTYFKIVRTEYDVLEERFTSMELGTLSVTLAEALGVNNDSGSYKGSSGGGGGVTGVKGDAELTYRTGNVNLTAANIGALPSNTAIHNVPSGGTSGQMLVKNSNSDYDLTWASPVGAVSDVQVNGTSVVTSGVANVPVARSDRYGVIKFDTDTDPGGGVIKVTYHAGNGNEITSYAPITQYISGSYTTIRSKFLPDFVGTDGNTAGTKGAVPAPATTDAGKFLKSDGTWATVSGSGGVSDVQINSTSIVSGGVATIPKATSAAFGVVEVFENNDPPDGYVKITDNSGGHYTPSIPSGTGTIRAKWLPDFVGTDGNTAGTKGAVPAPTSSDTDKYLKSDGTWATVSGGTTYTATSPIDITSDVISHENSGVTAGTYDGGAVKSTGFYVPSITVDAQGHITSASDLGNLIPLVTGSSSDLENGNLVTGYAYRSIVRNPAPYEYGNAYVLSAGQTSASFTLSDRYPGYNDSYYIQILSVEAIDGTTKEAVIVDWSVSEAYATAGNANSITLTVSIAEAYTNPIVIKPLIGYGTANVM